mmetsp:Transcript_34477/g.86583  ORF Transcript_34477/g.86583 Transcript_34477/m.86583 type:complete len:211 (+) Transcript_34477:102-734(+)
MRRSNARHRGDVFVSAQVCDVLTCVQAAHRVRDQIDLASARVLKNVIELYLELGRSLVDIAIFVHAGLIDSNTASSEICCDAVKVGQEGLVPAHSMTKHHRKTRNTKRDGELTVFTCGIRQRQRIRRRSEHAHVQRIPRFVGDGWPGDVRRGGRGRRWRRGGSKATSHARCPATPPQWYTQLVAQHREHVGRGVSMCFQRQTQCTQQILV